MSSLSNAKQSDAVPHVKSIYKELIDLLRSLPQDITLGEALKRTEPTYLCTSRGRKAKSIIHSGDEIVVYCAFYKRYFHILDTNGNPIFHKSNTTDSGFYGYSKKGRNAFNLIQKRGAEFGTALEAKLKKENGPFVDVKEEVRKFKEKCRQEAIKNIPPTYQVYKEDKQ